MRYISMFSALAFAFSVYGATEVSFTLSASTGDNDFDLTLRSINIEAQQSLPRFYTSMSLEFGAKKDDIDLLLYTHRLSPADAYFAIRLAFLIGKPIDYVIVRYHKYRKRGWGYIARHLGVKPGSEKFHRLRSGGYVVLDRSRKERQKVEVTVVKIDDRGKDRRDRKAVHHGKNGGKSTMASC